MSRAPTASRSRRSVGSNRALFHSATRQAAPCSASLIATERERTSLHIAASLDSPTPRDHDDPLRSIMRRLKRRRIENRANPEPAMAQPADDVARGVGALDMSFQSADAELQPALAQRDDNETAKR